MGSDLFKEWEDEFISAFSNFKEQQCTTGRCVFVDDGRVIVVFNNGQLNVQSTAVRQYFKYDIAELEHLGDPVVWAVAVFNYSNGI